MSEPQEYVVTHRQRLEAHLGEFSSRQRTRMAEIYDVDENTPEAIAAAWLSHPERFAEVVEEHVPAGSAWRVLEELVLEHDIGLSIGWATIRSRQILQRLGIAKTRRSEEGELWAVIPGAIAAMLAGRIQGQRPSMIMLLGRVDDEEIARLEALYGVAPEGSRIERVLRLAETFEQPDTVAQMVESLPNQDWIGDAMMVLELGGVCYWQQIYGYDLDPTWGEAPDEKIVPLMRTQDRQHQQDVAEHLLQAGVLFRFDDPVLHVPMVAVPEELWRELWTLGRRWLFDWIAQSFYDLSDQGARRAVTAAPADLQAVLKWLALELDREPLALSKGGHLNEASVSRLNAISEAPVNWEAVVSLATEARIFRAKKGRLERGVEFDLMLDVPRRRFARELLLEWVIGYSGERADRLMAEAIGLDDLWRRDAISMLRQSDEMVPRWMTYSGVPTHETGGGWLRGAGEGSVDAVIFEAGLVMGFGIALKMTWLDLVSLLEAERWYTVDSLVEMLQCTAAATMFSQLGMVLEHQHSTVYLPYQRASFFMDTYHGPKFREWLEAILDELLVPLGAAQRSEGGDLVYLDTRQLRIESPPGWPEEHRAEIIQEILADEELIFDLPAHGGPELRSVSLIEEAQPARVSVAEPLKTLRGLVGDRRVARFDGRYLELVGGDAE